MTTKEAHTSLSQGSVRIDNIMAIVVIILFASIRILQLVSKEGKREENGALIYHIHRGPQVPEHPLP